MLLNQAVKPRVTLFTKTAFGIGLVAYGVKNNGFDYFVIWNPPGSLEGNQLFPYLVVLAVSLRTLITLYEFPILRYA